MQVTLLRRDRLDVLQFSNAHLARLVDLLHRRIKQ